MTTEKWKRSVLRQALFLKSFVGRCRPAVGAQREWERSSTLCQWRNRNWRWIPGWQPPRVLVRAPWNRRIVLRRELLSGRLVNGRSRSHEGRNFIYDEVVCLPCRKEGTRNWTTTSEGGKESEQPLKGTFDFPFALQRTIHDRIKSSEKRICGVGWKSATDSAGGTSLDSRKRARQELTMVIAFVNVEFWGANPGHKDTKTWLREALWLRKKLRQTQFGTQAQGFFYFFSIQY